jgi:hypothetical protein
VTYKLLDRFRDLFQGTEYRHRRSNLGDQVASYLYDDLFTLARSSKFVTTVRTQSHVINVANVAVGRTARRGDGTFGERVPSVDAATVPDHLVSFGSVATIDVGIEVKILAKAMIKQIDRVGTDMINQASEFRRHGGSPICIGIVGINHASSYTSFEGDRAWPTDGRKHHIPSKKLSKLKTVWCRESATTSMRSSFSDISRLMSSHSLFFGSTRRIRNHSTLRACCAFLANTSYGSE